MAIYDPPDGSSDPRPRCVGHCCRCFSLEYPYQTVTSEYKRSLADSAYTSKIPDIRTIGAMLIPLGSARKQEIFTCRHLTRKGDCGIYASRPLMCREFPGPSPCPYRNCASHGPQTRLRRIINWLRE